MPCEVTCKEFEIVRKVDGLWKSSIHSPERFCFDMVEPGAIDFIFAEADRVRECNACRKLFQDTFQMPELWWFSWCRRANGYFGSEERVNSDGKIEAHNTWFRFIIKRFLPDGKTEGDKDYVWYKFNIFTHWVAQSRATSVLVFDARPEVKKLIVGSLGMVEPINGNEEGTAEKDTKTNMVVQISGVNSKHSAKSHVEKRNKQIPSPAPKPKTKALPEDDVRHKGFAPTRLLDRITDRISINPYAVHVLFMEDIAYQQDESVWGIRDRLRDFEKKRTSNPNYEQVHDIARHAIHVSETLDAGICTIASIKDEHDRFQKAQEPEKRKDLKPDDRRKREENEGARIRRGLDFSESMLRNLRFRSESNMTRLQNEIQLAYNNVSLNIGHATKADSKAMLGITFLTMIFLPPTFMSSIFSMSFFDYDSEKDHWAVSDKFWLWVATTVPLTLISFLYLGPRYLFKESVQFAGLQEPPRESRVSQVFQKWRNRHENSKVSPV